MKIVVVRVIFGNMLGNVMKNSFKFREIFNRLEQPMFTSFYSINKLNFVLQTYIRKEIYTLLVLISIIRSPAYTSFGDLLH